MTMLAAAVRRYVQGRRFPHELSFMIDTPARRLVLRPGALAERLCLSPSDTVLEVGCGPGYFSVEVARRLPRGHLQLVDVQHEMLQRARTKLSSAERPYAAPVQTALPSISQAGSPS